MSTLLLAMNASKNHEAVIERIATNLSIPYRTSNDSSEVLKVLKTGTRIAYVACDGESGESAISHLEQLSIRPGLSSIVLTAQEPNIGLAIRAGRAGAVAILSIHASEDLIVKEVRLALEEESRLDSVRETRAKLVACIESLAPTEYEVYRWVLSGVPNKMIAKRLQVSQRTIEARRQKVFRKLYVNSVAELVRLTSLFVDIEAIRAVVPTDEVIQYDEAG